MILWERVPDYSNLLRSGMHRITNPLASFVAHCAIGRELISIFLISFCMVIDTTSVRLQNETSRCWFSIHSLKPHHDTVLSRLLLEIECLKNIELVLAWRLLRKLTKLFHRPRWDYWHCFKNVQFWSLFFMLYTTEVYSQWEPSLNRVITEFVYYSMPWIVKL